MSTRSESDIESLEAEIKQLRADLAQLSETFRDVLRHGSTEALNRARESGERVWGEARRRAEGISEGIEQKPVAAALTAFGLGMILGMLFSHRH